LAVRRKGEHWVTATVKFGGFCIFGWLVHMRVCDF
jgi:hypothetical protein